MRVGGRVDRRVDPHVLEIGGPRHGARENGNHLVTFGELLDLGVERGLIEKSGAWFEVGGERIGPGREKAAEALRSTGAVADDLERKLREAGPDAKAPSPTQAEAAA